MRPKANKNRTHDDGPPGKKPRIIAVAGNMGAGMSSLVAWLRCPTKALVRRIEERGRDYERAVPRSYPKALDALYEEWHARYDLSPTLVIETDRLDYVARLFDRLEVTRAIRERLGE